MKPGIVATARALADDLLFPAAPETDRASRIPESNLSALADSGLYGPMGSTRYGGLGAGSDPETVAGVVEALASGCLSTTLVWAQHHSLVKALMTRGVSPAMRSEWLGPLCRGERRAGVALGGVLPGPPRLRALPVGDGWRLVGTSPWVSGWGMVDVLHVGARGPDGIAVWLLVDAVDGDDLMAHRHHMAALDSSSTVELTFSDLLVPASRVVAVEAYSEATYSGVERLRFNGYLALGVANRCLMMLAEARPDRRIPVEGLDGNTLGKHGAYEQGSKLEQRAGHLLPVAEGLADGLARCRADLYAATEESIAEARSSAAHLAWRSAAALVVNTGSRSLLVDDHAQRLAREAMFLLVFGTRPPIREGLLGKILDRAAEPPS